VLFVELRFLPFFLVVFASYWGLRGARARKLWLLLASLVFYGAWDWRFLGLLLFSTGLDYRVGLALERPGARRRAWLALSLAGNLGLLAFFKYFAFFTDSAVALLQALGFQAHRPTLAVLLPVGISFYTFQTLSYTLDIYRGNLRATRSLTDFALFVCFFPQLVAGPIVRATEFLPQLGTPKSLARVDGRAAAALFLVGYFKKACVSDTLAPVVDRFFEAPAAFDVLSAWTAVLVYAAQIYCDFSGYSDMAIALAALLGYELGRNFARPYLACGITDFWRRWHVSLSSWLRDYLYVPLGGNRGGRWRTYRNLLLTMLLGGLWHGAAWTFVAWGGLHGLALAVARVWRERAGPDPLARPWRRAVAWLVTLYFVCLCWVFFRAQDFADAWTTVRSLVLLDARGPERLERGTLVLLALLLALHALSASALGARFVRVTRAVPLWSFSLAYGAAVALVLSLVPANPRPFIYFQF
jgi:alginate O-acetyltransferase complex protein AlgI